MNAIEEDLLVIGICLAIIIFLFIVPIIAFKCHCETLLLCWRYLVNCCCVPFTAENKEQNEEVILV